LTAIGATARFRLDSARSGSNNIKNSKWPFGIRAAGQVSRLLGIGNISAAIAIKRVEAVIDALSIVNHEF
jgi:hypothetical protein